MAKPPKSQGMWVATARKPDAAEKRLITERCEALIETFFRPNLLPEINPTEWNYPVDIRGIWHGGRYRFVQRYRSGMAHNVGEEFDAPFARLDCMPLGRFDIYWHRHTGQWWRLHSGLTLDEALEMLRTDGLLHAV